VVRVKICGITSVEDALTAAEAGADAIGLNFVSGPRQMTPAAAEAILRSLPAMVTPVALVRLQGGAVPDELLELLGQFWVSHIQIYGDFESQNLDILRRDGFRPIPVVSVRDRGFADQAAAWWPKGGEPSAAAVVLDAYDPDRPGGTGSHFRWEWVSAARQAGRLDGWPPIVLAGGLRPENVAEAIRVARPYAVDVSSGVEVEGVPGRKDPLKMQAFVRAARAEFGQFQA